MHVSIHYLPGTVIGTEGTAEDKTALMELTFCQARTSVAKGRKARERSKDCWRGVGSNF